MARYGVDDTKSNRLQSTHLLVSTIGIVNDKSFAKYVRLSNEVIIIVQSAAFLCSHVGEDEK